MDVRTAAGALGTVLAAAAVGVGIGGLIAGSGSTGGLFAPSVATFAAVGVAVLALALLGVRGGERLRTPYW